MCPCGALVRAELANLTREHAASVVAAAETIAADDATRGRREVVTGAIVTAIAVAWFALSFVTALAAVFMSVAILMLVTGVVVTAFGVFRVRRARHVMTANAGW